MGRKGHHEVLVSTGIPIALAGQMDGLSYEKHSAMTGFSPSTASVKKAQNDLRSMGLTDPDGPYCPASKMEALVQAAKDIFQSGVSTGKDIQHALQVGQATVSADCRADFEHQFKKMASEKNVQIDQLQKKIDDQVALLLEKDHEINQIRNSMADAMHSAQVIKNDLVIEQRCRQEAEARLAVERQSKEAQIAAQAEVNRELDMTVSHLKEVLKERDAARVTNEQLRAEHSRAWTDWRRERTTEQERLLTIIHALSAHQAIKQGADGLGERGPKSSELDLA